MDIKELQQQVETLTAQNTELTEAASSHAGAIESLETERDEAKAKVTEHEATISELASDVASRDETITSKDAEITAAKAEATSATEKYDTLKADFDEKLQTESSTQAQDLLKDLAAEAGVPLEDVKQSEGGGGKDELEGKSGYEKIAAATKVA